MSPDTVTYFANFIAKELGIIYSDFNSFQLQNRLEEITRIVGAKDVPALHVMAQTAMTPNLKQLILDIATNNETSFFRDPRIFKAVTSGVFPELFGPAAKSPGSRVRIWSAACSAGQEPYSLSMLLSELGEQKGVQPNVEIVATDISSRVLEKAKQARYSQLEVQRGLAAQLLVKNFTKDDENFWSVKPEIKNRVSFQILNLLESFDRMGSFDLIFCRNVLIYQNVESKIKIIEKLGNCLRPGGFLVLGAGESMIGLSNAFDIFKCEEAILYRKKTAIAAKVA